MEKELVEYLLSLESMMFGLTTNDVGSKTYRGEGTNGPTTTILNLRDYE